MENSTDYNLFYSLLDKYGPLTFTDVDKSDPLVVKLDEMMESCNQFYYFGDLLAMNIIYTSPRCMEMLGIDPAIISPLHFFNATHPDDIKRLSLGRAKLLKMAHDLFIAEKGSTLLSTNFRMRNADGNYSNLLIQLYVYYATIPYKSVFVFKVHTNIDWCKKLKHGYHYYVGDDLSHFRFPDEKLLSIGNVFSEQEFKIIKLIAQGLTSIEISDKLYISKLTVDTHRKNILRKTGKPTISDLIFDLMERGII